MKEIITLQFGADANFIGSHFWNTQEAYFSDYSAPDPEDPKASLPESGGLKAVDHNVHFRTGLSVEGTETFLPRALVYDTRSQFGALAKENALYHGFEDEGELWSGQRSTTKAERISPSAYTASLDSFNSTTERQKHLSDSQIRYWSDYLHIYYHPRSLVGVTVPHEHASELGPTYATGRSEAGPQKDRAGSSSTDAATIADELWAQLDGANRDGWEDDLRPLLEEADLLQGLSVISNVTGPWGPVAVRAAERIRDELPKTDLWVWAVEGPTARRPRNAAGLARSLSELVPLVTLYVPLPECVPGWAPVRDGRGRVSEWRMSALQALVIDSALAPTRLLRGGAGMGQLSATLSVTGTRRVANVGMLMRTGAGEEVVYRPVGDRFLPGQKAPAAGKVFDEVQIVRGEWDMEALQANEGDGVVKSFYKTDLETPVVETMPALFPVPGRRSIPSRTVLQTGSGLADRIGNLAEFVRRAKSAVPGSEREELVSALEDVRDEYKDGWESEEWDD